MSIDTFETRGLAFRSIFSGKLRPVENPNKEQHVTERLKLDILVICNTRF